MPKITAASIALTALVALALTGCAGTTEPAADESQKPTETTQVVETEQAPDATPEPVLTAPPEPTGSEATYLFEVRKRTDVTTIVEATDEQLLATGHAACEALASNPDIHALRLVEGETPGVNDTYVTSSVIGWHAREFLC